MAEPDDDQALRAKLDALKAALARRSAEKRAKEAGGPTNSERAATASAISMAFSAAGEFAGAIVVRRPDRLAARPRAGNQAGVPDRAFSSSARRPGCGTSSALTSPKAP